MSTRVAHKSMPQSSGIPMDQYPAMEARPACPHCGNQPDFQEAIKGIHDGRVICRTCRYSLSSSEWMRASRGVPVADGQALSRKTPMSGKQGK